MPGLGEYLADVTEGITRVEDLPKAKVIIRSRNYKGCRCPCCGRRAYRLRRAERLLHDLSDLKSGRPHDIHPVSGVTGITRPEADMGARYDTDFYTWTQESYTYPQEVDWFRKFYPGREVSRSDSNSIAGAG